MVIPLMARKYKTDNDWLNGSGFLACINSETYLVTVAHLCDQELAPRSDWSLWPDNIFLADTEDVDVEDGLPLRKEQFALFIEGHKGKRVPKFKYLLRPERPGTIADIILLPLQPEDLVVKMYSSFNLPADRGPHEPGAVVNQLGRRNEFPDLSVTKHNCTQQAGPLRFIRPEGQPGDSGGPVVSASGLLLGMNVGSHVQLPNEGMAMSPEAIEALATSIRGVAKDWPQFESAGSTSTQL